MIDDHVHPFPLDYQPLDPVAISLAGPGGGRRLATELMTGRLSRLLDVDPDAAVTERDAVAAGGWSAWVRRLLDDAGVAGLLLDDGIGGVEPAPLEAYQRVAGRPIWRLARMDPLVDRLIDDGASAAEILDAVKAFLGESAAGGCVGFKSILAYRTGLAVDPQADLAAAQRSLDPEVTLRRRGKALRDLIMRAACGVAADLGLPIQVHTGFGDPDIRLAEANPLLLEDLLRTPEGAAATIVLIHGSHPWERAAAYLATAKPNVYTELSLSNLFAPLGTADRLLALLDLAPTDKVLVGSDGHGPPETIWFACRVLADAWQRVTGVLADAGARPDWVEGTRVAVFEGNARRIYRLPEG